MSRSEDIAHDVKLVRRAEELDRQANRIRVDQAAITKRLLESKAESERYHAEGRKPPRAFLKQRDRLFAESDAFSARCDRLGVQQGRLLAELEQGEAES